MPDDEFIIYKVNKLKEICFISRRGVVCPKITAAFSPSRIQSRHGTEWKDNSSRGGKAALRRLNKNGEALQGWKKEEEGRSSSTGVEEWTRTLVGALLFSSPSQTLRLTPLTSALRAARAHDAVLRMYPDLPLRFIKIHGDILVSYAKAHCDCYYFCDISLTCSLFAVQEHWQFLLRRRIKYALSSPGCSNLGSMKRHNSDHVATRELKFLYNYLLYQRRVFRSLTLRAEKRSV